jgi:hypothetical protein
VNVGAAVSAGDVTIIGGRRGDVNLRNVPQPVRRAPAATRGDAGLGLDPQAQPLERLLRRAERDEVAPLVLVHSYTGGKITITGAALLQGRAFASLSRMLCVCVCVGTGPDKLARRGGWKQHVGRCFVWRLRTHGRV